MNYLLPFNNSEPEHAGLSNSSSLIKSKNNTAPKSPPLSILLVGENNYSFFHPEHRQTFPEKLIEIIFPCPTIVVVATFCFNLNFYQDIKHFNKENLSTL